MFAWLLPSLWLCSVLCTTFGTLAVLELFGAPWTSLLFVGHGALGAILLLGLQARDGQRHYHRLTDEECGLEEAEPPAGRCVQRLVGIPLDLLMVVQITGSIVATVAFFFFDLLWCVGEDGVVEPSWKVTHKKLVVGIVFYILEAVLLGLWLLIDICYCCSRSSCCRGGRDQHASNRCCPSSCVRRGAALATGRPLPGESQRSSHRWRLRLGMKVSSGLWLVGAGLVFFSTLLDGFASFEATDCVRPGCYEDCHPLSASHKGCLLPFPSTTWEKSEASGSTGLQQRLEIPESALPWLRSGRRLNLQDAMEGYDGWSPLTAILFELPGLPPTGGASPPGAGHRMVGVHSLSASVQPGSATLLLNAATGAPVLHYSERDTMSEPQDVGILQPAEPLLPGNRYIVVVQDIRAADGKLLPPTQAFVQLWADARKLADSDLAPNASIAADKASGYYANKILPVLASAGVKLIPDLDLVQLCWDFTVRSTASFAGMRLAQQAASWTRQVDNSSRHTTPDDAANAEVRPQGSSDPKWKFNFRVVKKDVLECDGAPSAPRRRPGFKEDELTAMVEEVFKHRNTFGVLLHGRLSIPRIISSAARDSGLQPELLQAAATNASLLASLLSQSPLEEVPVLVGIPCDLLVNREGLDVGRVLVVGHGLFTTRGELKDLHNMRSGANLDAVVVATDFRGFSRHDQPVVIKTLLREPEMLREVAANLLQGHVSQAGMVVWASSKLRDEDSLARTLSNHKETQHLRLLSPPEVIYYGISAGGILGSGLVTSYAPFSRAVLGVPGLPFTFLLPRSNNFVLYKKVLLRTVYSGLALRVVLSLAQLYFDEVTGVTRIAENSMGVPSLTPQVLLQAGLGDANVPRLGAEVLARTYGHCAAFESAWSVNPYGDADLHGIEKVSSSSKQPHVNRSKPACWLTEVDYQKEQQAMPTSNIFPPGSHVHFCLRRDPYVMLQNVHFMKSGEVIDICGAGHCHREDASISCDQFM